MVAVDTAVDLCRDSGVYDHGPHLLGEIVTLKVDSGAAEKWRLAGHRLPKCAYARRRSVD